MASDGEAKLYTPSDKYVSEKRENRCLIDAVLMT